MIFVTFTVLVALLLLVLVFSRLPWLVKTALIAVVFAFCFLVWSAQSTTAGWPTARPIPSDAQFVSCVTVEPDSSHNVAGAIYLWLIPLQHDHGIFAYKPSLYEPRAYQEPYSEDLQAACQQAQKMAASGTPVRLATIKAKHKGGVRGAQGAITEQGRYRAYKLPPVLPPRKTR